MQYEDGDIEDYWEEQVVEMLVRDEAEQDQEGDAKDPKDGELEIDSTFPGG